ncbi:MAG: hypothetical protein WAT25_09400 [Paracoccaceae bacterium]
MTGKAAIIGGGVIGGGWAGRGQDVFGKWLFSPKAAVFAALFALIGAWR